jgi:DNA polymerase-3 subunit beta
MPKAKKSESGGLRATCVQADLAKGLGVVARAVAARSTLPILGNILIGNDPTSLNRLRLQATNLEVGITCYLHGHIDADGAITVPARTMVDLVNAMPNDEQVTLEVTEKTQTLSISAGRYHNNIKGVDAQEFPVVPVGGDLDDCQLQISTGDLCGLIERVAFSAAKDEARPILTGVYTILNGRTMTMAAADGFRLSTDNALSITAIEKPKSVIVPAKALLELSRIMGDQAEPIGVSLLGNGNEPTQILFHLTHADLVSQLLDGKYPDYKAILPEDTTTIVTVDGAQLAIACKAANVFAREAQNIMAFTAHAGELIVQATSTETGDNNSVIDATVTGPDVTIAFNVQYVKDLLGVLDKHSIQIHLTDAAHAGLFTDETLPNFRGVVMPMSINGRVNTAEPGAEPEDPTPVQNEGQNEEA